MGFALVFGIVALLFPAVGATPSFFSPTGCGLSSGPLRLLPSSKNLLFPSLGLVVFIVAEVEIVREVDLGLSTLMPVSLRWYEGSRALFVPTQSRPALEGTAGVVAADEEDVSRRQEDQIAGLLSEREGVFCAPEPVAVSGGSARVFSWPSDGREAVD